MQEDVMKEMRQCLNLIGFMLPKLSAALDALEFEHVLHGEAAEPAEPKKRRISAAGRRAIVAAQRKRWAAKKAAAKVAPVAAAKRKAAK